MDQYIAPINTLQFKLANLSIPTANLMHTSSANAAAAARGLPVAVAQGMTGLAEFLATDVGAAWALAGELSNGVPAMQAVIFGYGSIGLSVAAVGLAAYGATTWIDESLDGALHTGVLEALEMIARMDPGVADEYFGSDGFTFYDEQMMSDICSNWEEFWEDVPAQIIAPIPLPPLQLV